MKKLFDPEPGLVALVDYITVWRSFNGRDDSCLYGRSHRREEALDRPDQLRIVSSSEVQSEVFEGGNTAELFSDVNRVIVRISTHKFTEPTEVDFDLFGLSEGRRVHVVDDDVFEMLARAAIIGLQDLSVFTVQDLAGSTKH